MRSSDKRTRMKPRLGLREAMAVDRRLLGPEGNRQPMLFGRLRVPLERDSLRDLGKSLGSGVHVIPPLRGGSPHPDDADEFRGLDRLDREELDE